MRRSAIALAAIVALASLSGCGSGDVQAADPGTGESAILPLPSQIAGLRVVAETLSEEDLAKIDRPYVDTISVFSLREKDLLRATIQIARFNRVARPDDNEFRGSIIGVLGGRRPVELNVGGTTINATAGTAQNIFAWFSGRGMFVLSVQQDYPFPRTLLRRLIDLDLKL